MKASENREAVNSASSQHDQLLAMFINTTIEHTLTFSNMAANGNDSRSWPSTSPPTAQRTQFGVGRNRKKMGQKHRKLAESMGKPWENHGKTMGKPWEIWIYIYIYTYLYGKTLGKWWFIQEKHECHGIFLMPLKLQFWRVYTTHKNNLGMVYCWVTHELLWLSWRFLNLVNEIGWIRAISRTSIQGWI